MPEARPIDGNALIKKMCFRCKKGDGEGMCAEHCDFIAAFDSVPTLDAVPVVRCKDCKHAITIPDRYPALKRAVGYTLKMCDIQRGHLFGGVNLVGNGGFCDEGERREDNG